MPLNVAPPLLVVEAEGQWLTVGVCVALRELLGEPVPVPQAVEDREPEEEPERVRPALELPLLLGEPEKVPVPLEQPLALDDAEGQWLMLGVTEEVGEVEPQCEGVGEVEAEADCEGEVLTLRVGTTLRLAEGLDVEVRHIVGVELTQGDTELLAEEHVVVEGVAHPVPERDTEGEAVCDLVTEGEADTEGQLLGVAVFLAEPEWEGDPVALPLSEKVRVEVGDTVVEEDFEGEPLPVLQPLPERDTEPLPLSVAEADGQRDTVPQAEEVVQPVELRLNVGETVAVRETVGEAEVDGHWLGLPLPEEAPLGVYVADPLREAVEHAEPDRLAEGEEEVL